jgi:hypothetical protein
VRRPRRLTQPLGARKPLRRNGAQARFAAGVSDGRLTGGGRVVGSGGAVVEPILTAAQVGERLQLRPREVRRLFGHIAIRLGRKLVRFVWGDVVAELDRYRQGGTP